VLAYCWRCETPLSNTETRMDDVYRDRQDPALTVWFRLLTKTGRPSKERIACLDDHAVDAALEPGPGGRSRRDLRRTGEGRRKGVRRRGAACVLREGSGGLDPDRQR
jgi:hypothetical protein